jgi:hypothetical protein
MQVIEDIASKQVSFSIKEWKTFVEEIKESLKRAYDFQDVSEESYEYTENEKLSIFIKCTKIFDEYSIGLIEVYLSFEIFEKGAKVNCSVKGSLHTEYPEKTQFQRSIIYYLIRSLWDKLYYGELRGKWKSKTLETVNRVYKDIINLSRSL